MWLTQPLFYIEQEMTTLLLMCRHPNYSIHSKSEPAKSIILELVRASYFIILPHHFTTSHLSDIL